MIVTGNELLGVAIAFGVIHTFFLVAIIVLAGVNCEGLDALRKKLAATNDDGGPDADGSVAEEGAQAPPCKHADGCPFLLWDNASENKEQG